MRRSKEDSIKKNKRTFFGYKGHVIIDYGNPVPIISSFAVTAAKGQGSKISLSKLGINLYMEIGWFDSNPKDIDGTIDLQGTINCPLNPLEETGGYPVNRPRLNALMAIMKRMFHFLHYMITLDRRLQVIKLILNSTFFVQ